MGSRSTAIAAGWKWDSAAWAVLAVILTIDIVWCARIGLTIGHWHEIAAAMVISLIASALYRYRNRTIAAWAEGAALMIGFTASGCVLTYLAASTGRPLQDAAFIGIDRALGFDWLSWQQTVLPHSWLYWPLWFAYASLPLQMLLGVFALPIIGEGARMGELVVLGAATLVLTAIVSALCPVIGPFGTYGAGSEAWLDDFLALRSGGPWTFDLPAMQGI